MFKRLMILVLSLALLLSACANTGSGATTTAVPTTKEVETTEVAETSGVSGCTVVSQDPTPGPTEQSLFPAVTEDDWVKGPDDAYVTIMEYSDFMCPGCAGVAPILTKIQATNPEDVRVVYRHFPLESIHDKAAIAAQAAEAAGAQGEEKFWKMHDVLFARQSEWTDMTVEDFQVWVKERADELKLDAEEFEAVMTAEETAKKVNDAWENGQAIGMPGTPFILINGQFIGTEVPLSYEFLSANVNLFLLAPKQFTTCPPITVDASKQYLATLHTERGDIVMELLADKAPMAVSSFIFLAKNGWFDGITFHRVIPGFVAQTGDPSETGYGGPGYNFANEVADDLKFDQAGLVGMANSGPGTNGSQFFITFAPAPNLDGSYTIFARVISGMDIAEQLTARDPSQDMGLPPGDKLISVSIEEK